MTRLKTLGEVGALGRLVAEGPYDLANRLRQALHAGKSPADVATNFRVDVVSPELCDDTLDLLAPSLQDYRHCDVVDVYPGAGLWSSKVHERLRPRRHILVEPDARYLPFLEPLVRAPGSAYRHLAWDPARFAAYSDVLDAGVLPEQAARPAGPGGVNRTLLLLCTLSQFPLRPRYGYQSINQQLLVKVTESILARSGVHRYGATRMLIWAPDSHRTSFLPQHVVDRRPAAVLLDKVAAAHAVVTGGEYTGHVPHRQGALWSAQRAVERADQGGVRVPARRWGAAEREARASLHRGAAVPFVGGEGWGAGTALWTHTWDGELARLQRTLGRAAAGPDEGDRTARSRRRRDTLRKHASLSRRGQGVVADLIRLDLEVHAWEMAAAHGGTEAERVAARAEWAGHVGSLRAKVRALTEDLQGKFRMFAEGFRAACQDPPLLAWDRRPHEPLAADEGEVWPRMPLMLMDVRPRDGEGTARDAASARSWFQMNRLIAQTAGSSLPEALGHLAPGADEALLPAVPDLADPAKGGRLDPRDLRSRMVTVNMLDGLVQAYMDWPFRPDEETAAFYGGSIDRAV